MNKQLTILAVMLLWLAGCKPYSPEPLPTESEPVFLASGSIDGVNLDLTADGNALEANTTTITDSLNVLVHNGFLHQNQNIDQPKLSVEFRSISENDLNIESVLNQNSIPVRYVASIDSVEFYNVALSADFIHNPQSVEWTILGQTYTSNNVEFEVLKDASNTKIPVTLAASFTSGCSRIINDTVYLPNHGCDAQISAMFIDSTTFEYTANTTGATGFDYEWTFSSNGLQAIVKSARVFYGSNMPDKEELTLKISNQNGSATKRFAYDLTGGASCDANLNYDVTSINKGISGSATADFGEVVINYFENDVRFSSENIEQPAEGKFEILSYEEYVDEFSPEKSYIKVNMLFSGLLSDGSKTISVTDLNITLPYEI